jgi:hypothetical protein
MMFSRRSKAHLLASQEYDEESGDIKGSVRVGKCPPTRVLRWWFGAIAMLVLFLAGLRWLERWQQIRNRVADAQASGALLQGSAYVDRLVVLLLVERLVLILFSELINVVLNTA